MAIYLVSADNRARQGKLVQALLENQTKMQEVLARCSSTPARSEAPVQDQGT
jgi:hypothetical protein